MTSSTDPNTQSHPAKSGAKCLRIDSYADLLKHEPEILGRIEALPNGGNLFLIHPFLLFEDIGVELSERARNEIINIEPALAGLSAAPYQALKASNSRQSFEVRLKGLFGRRSA